MGLNSIGIAITGSRNNSNYLNSFVSKAFRYYMLALILLFACAIGLVHLFGTVTIFGVSLQQNWLYLALVAGFFAAINEFVLFVRVGIDQHGGLLTLRYCILFIIFLALIGCELVTSIDFIFYAIAIQELVVSLILVLSVSRFASIQ